MKSSLLAITLVVASSDIALAQWRGRVEVITVPQDQIRRYCRGGTGFGIIRGCAWGGVKQFEGLRGVCRIYLSDQAAPYVLPHERAHCDGWEHP